MTIRDIISLLDAEIISAADLDLEVKTACGSDMMSDVLAFVKDQSVLLTGLLNPQVVRTAEMMDMRCIVFVRGKQPDDSIVELAKKMDITLLKTRYRLFTAESCMKTALGEAASKDEQNAFPLHSARRRLYPGGRGLQQREEKAEAAGL